MENKKRLIDANKAQAVLVNMAEHLLEAGNPEMAGAVGYAAEVIGKQKTVDAVEALRAYAYATDNKTLAEDIYNWVGKGVPVQEWIPVAERLPNEAGKYLTVVKSCLGSGDTYIRLLWYGHGFHYSDPDIGDVQMNRYVTHWMPLPEPPEKVE